jgi:hypothetical protein
VNLGDTFVLDHLWVIASLPTSEGLVAGLYVTTWGPRSDETCELNVGDHPFVRHRSTIAYSAARMFSAAQLETVLTSVICKGTRAAVSAALLERIQAGALASDLTPQKVQRAIAASMPRQATTTPAAAIPPTKKR